MTKTRTAAEEPDRPELYITLNSMTHDRFDLENIGVKKLETMRDSRRGQVQLYNTLTALGLCASSGVAVLNHTMHLPQNLPGFWESCSFIVAGVSAVTWMAGHLNRYEAREIDRAIVSLSGDASKAAYKTNARMFEKETSCHDKQNCDVVTDQSHAPKPQ